MKTEFSINPNTGEMVVRRADETLLTRLQSYLGEGQEIECGQIRQAVSIGDTAGTVRIAGIVHGSMVDGPGLRSVASLQGCSHGCPGCHAKHAHSFTKGIGLTISGLARELLRADIPRDGVTISGGDPLGQPLACAEIVGHLKDAGVHVIVYTGFTFEQLICAKNAAIENVLALADVLVDGPFIAALKDESLAYRGSSNQRVINLVKTRDLGRLCLLDWD